MYSVKAKPEKLPSLQLSIITSNYNGFSISCFGLSDGEIKLTVNSGSPPYTYQWSNGLTVEDLTNLAPGFYKVVVTDANLDIDSIEVTLTSPDQLTAAINGFQNVSCNGGSDGFINVALAGGAGLNSFQWSNGQTTENLANLQAAAYTLTISDVNGCTTSIDQVITEPDVISFTTSSSNEFCGLANG